MENKEELIARLKEEKPAMEVRDLSFAYGENQILKDISLMIKGGKITTIMGANGCGKSTLFSLMTKNLNPNRGKVFLHGKNIKNLKLNEFARKVSIVHQYNQAANDITVERLILLQEHRLIQISHQKLLPTTHLALSCCNMLQK